MTGSLKLVLPLAFTDLTLPKLRYDAVLPDAGALALIEPMHPKAQWASGVPADLATLENIAWEQAVALLGGSQASMRATVRIGANFTSSVGLMERTGKGGLHGMISQVGDNKTAFTGGYNIQLPVAVRNRIHKSAGGIDKIYHSVWGRATRNPTSGGLDYFHGGGRSNDYLFDTSGTLKTFPSSTDDPLVTESEMLVKTSSAIGTPFFLASGSMAAFRSGYQLAQDAADGGPSFIFGNGLSGSSSGNNNKRGSKIFYRMYHEDLSVSGRTFAQVAALDYAEYTRQVLTAGGRYYGDTYSDPATTKP